MAAALCRCLPAGPFSSQRGSMDYAKAFKARRADGVESVELKESVSKVRARSLPTRRCLLLTNPCPIP